MTEYVADGLFDLGDDSPFDVLVDVLDARLDQTRAVALVEPEEVPPADVVALALHVVILVKIIIRILSKFLFTEALSLGIALLLDIK